MTEQDRLHVPASPRSSWFAAPVSRRSLLRAASVAGLVAPLGLLGARVAAQTGAPRTIKIAWSPTAVCQSPVSVALERGFFAQQGLQVENLNFGGSTDQLLEAIATGHADGGIGMALRWLKPLEQGFDVKLAVGTHGGCMRLLTADTRIKSILDLRGKSVAVTDQASPVKNFFAIQAANAGIGPDEIDWRQYPQDLFGEALRKGEVQALAGDDPQMYLIREREALTQIATNLDGDNADRTCCVLGLRGALLKNEPDVAAKLVRAVIAAQKWTAENPDETARIFAPHVPAKVPADTLAAMLRSHTHGHASTGAQLRSEVARFTNDLKNIKVIKPTTDAVKFASVVAPDVLI